MKKILLLFLMGTSTLAYCFGWRFGLNPRFNATGGTISTANSYRIHTYLSNGTFQVTSGQATIEYLVIGEGGGGSSSGEGGGAWANNGIGEKGIGRIDG